MPALTVADLATVVYSAGRVFEAMATGRRAVDVFLRSGSIEGIASRSDLNLLQDLRDCAQLIIDHAGRTIDAAFACEVNSEISRSGALRPGQLRVDPEIGVNTRHGRHQPPVLAMPDLQEIVESATSSGDSRAVAVDLFVDLAKAQPFNDGNKRTALFVANAALLGAAAGVVLTVPVDDSAAFNDLLARAYIFGEGGGVKNLLHARGFTALGS